MTTMEEIEFIIKNPSKPEDNFKLTVAVESTLADIQRKISETYHGKPDPSLQTVLVQLLCPHSESQPPFGHT